MGTHTGETIQDKSEKPRRGAIPASRLGIFQSDHQHINILPRGTRRGERGNDLGHDDVPDLYRRTTQFADRTIHQLLASLPRRENQSGTIRRNPPERRRRTNLGGKGKRSAGKP